VSDWGSTVVSLLLPKKNLPRNFVAEFFALLNRDTLYLVMFLGWVVLPLLRGRSSSCASIGFKVMEVTVHSRGLLASCVNVVLIGIAGGSSGAVVGRGGSGG